MGAWLRAKRFPVRVRDGYDGEGEMIKLTRKPVWFAHRDAEEFEFDADVASVTRDPPSKTEADKARRARETARKADAKKAAKIRDAQEKQRLEPPEMAAA